MNSCTIFSSNPDLLSGFLALDNKNGNIQLDGQPDNWKSLSIETTRAYPKATLTVSNKSSSREGVDFNNMIMGMFHFFQNIPTPNTEVQSQILTQIQHFHVAYGFVASTEIDVFKDWVFEFAKAVDGFVFWNGHSLFNSEEELLLNTQGISQVNDFVAQIPSPKENLEDLSADQIARKKQSEKEITERKLKVNTHLPHTKSEQDIILKSPTEIAQRCAILAAVNLFAFENINQEEITAYFDKFHLWNWVTEKEKFFIKNPSPEIRRMETWKAESIWILLWLLKKIDRLDFPNNLCNLNEIESYPFKGMSEGPENFIASAKEIRSAKEIMDTLDLIYRIHWACVDARLKNEPINDVHPGVVYERHYTLNWVTNYREQDWDNISTDT